MNNLYQSVSSDSLQEENFYQAMLLKYKQDKKRQERLKKILAKENEKLTQGSLTEKKKFFSIRKKIPNFASYFDKNKLNRPKDNLASHVKNMTSYSLDGAGTGAQKLTKQQLDSFTKLVTRLGQYEEVRKTAKPLTKFKKGKNIAQAINKRIPLDQLSDLAETLSPYEDIAALGKEFVDYDDFVQKNEEGQTQVNLKKAKRVAKAGYRAGKAVKQIKQAKEAAKVAKAAKTVETGAKAAEAGAKAAKVAKTAKSVKTALNVGKLITVGAAAETVAISLIITVVIWYIQIIGAHIIKNKYIPKMSIVDWLGFTVLYLVVFIVEILPFVLILAPIGIGVEVYTRLIDFLMGFSPSQVIRWIESATSTIM